MFDWFAVLFDTSDFPARWRCGNWSDVHGWIHITADLVTWAAYTAIPLTLAYFITRRRDVVFPRIFWLFAVFIFSCGTVHLVEAGIFWWPVYRVSALIKVVTATVSALTVVALVRATPAALALPALATVNRRLEEEIQERERVTAAIRQSEERYRSLVAATSSIVWTTDPGGRFVVEQPSWTEYTGQSFEEARGMGWTTMIHPEDREAVRKRWDAALDGQERYTGEGRLWSREHQAYRRFEAAAAPVRVSPQDRRVREWIGTVTDVDDRVRAEEALRRSDERMHLAVEASPTGMLLVNAAGNVVMANSRSAEMFGFDRADEVVGISIDEVVPPAAREGHARLRSDFMLTPSARAMGPGRDLHAVRRDGSEFPVEVGLTPIETDEGPLVLASVLDITERKEAVRALRRANEELRHKNQEIEQFVYTVSHDLKAPLVTCEGFVGILKRRLDDGNREAVDDCVERVRRATRRMGEMIEDILRLSRLGQLSQGMEPVALGPIVEQIAGDLREVHADDDVRIDVQGELPMVRGNPNGVREVFENLLGNAIKYGRRPGEPIRVRVGSETDAREIRCFVEDDGPGVPSESREAIFQMYHRLDAGSDGSGLGLAIVSRILQVHGGRAWMESSDSGGARAVLSFPVPGA